MSVTVRAARLGDVDAICDLETVSFPADPWSPVLVEEAVAGLVPTTSYLVADRDSRVVGYAVVCVVQDLAELQRIATEADERRTGVASALLDAVDAHARAGGAERILLEVREDNAPARAFYAGTGFTEISRRARYYRDGTDAVVLERFVRMTP
ncbi:ribosomal protein S18-alanine N-acetyltransferase [Nocardioides sp. MH1]|uniref:ribosomal protein S18-alanine N-acetyltransferase n=1 Tax=Nocardioides sp. MH1 TaxID=3242490 RepID=UPI00351FABDF